ncbi:hypothetical protein DFH11DRAFT_1596165 [Phellopilus nigrolimitatus]|nr:hypothetical protein DFH11DRAFT_1596165 [Phellopilus nigrolimitatus]
MPQNGSGERIVYPLVHTNAQGQALGRPVYPLRTSAHEFPMTQAPDLFLAIDQYRPSLPSPSYPGSTPNFSHSSVDYSHNSVISPPPHPHKLVSATVGMEGMEEGIMHGPSHASGHSQHENVGQGVSSIAIEPAGPIGQQPRKSQKTTNRNPCTLCKYWHVRCVVVADELGPLCEQCRGRGLRCEFPRNIDGFRYCVAAYASHVDRLARSITSFYHHLSKEQITPTGKRNGLWHNEFRSSKPTLILLAEVVSLWTYSSRTWPVVNPALPADPRAHFGRENETGGKKMFINFV